MKLDFYGCSLTAGDELCDDVFFPWKHECSTQEEYYNKRGEYFRYNLKLNEEYKRQNAEIAYPAHIAKLTNSQVFNHANNGASLREMIHKIIRQVSSNEKTDCIFLQLPPTCREFLITDNPFSVQMASLIVDDTIPSTTRYVQEKVSLVTFYSWTADDFVDLIMLDSLLKTKNIPHVFVEFGPCLEIRKRELEANKNFGFLNDQIDALNIIDLAKDVEATKLLGGHYDADSHRKFAEHIVNNILKL